MFLANFIFVVSLLKIDPAAYLNTLKALTSLQSKRKIQRFTSFCYSCFNSCLIKINGSREPGCTNRADKNSLQNDVNVTISQHIENAGIVRTVY